MRQLNIGLQKEIQKIEEEEEEVQTMQKKEAKSVQDLLSREYSFGIILVKKKTTNLFECHEQFSDSTADYSSSNNSNNSIHTNFIEYLTHIRAIQKTNLLDGPMMLQIVP